MELVQSVLLAAVGGALGLVSARLGAHWQLRATVELERLKLSNANRVLLHEARVEAYSGFFQSMSLARPILRHLDDDGPLRRDVKDAWDARNQMWEGYTRLALIGHKSIEGQAYKTIQVVDEVIRQKRPYVEQDYSRLVREWIDVCRGALIPAEANQLMQEPAHVERKPDSGASSD